MTCKAVGRSIINYAAPVWSTNLLDTNYRNILRAAIHTVFGYMSGTRECQQLHHHEGPPPPKKETLFTRHCSTVEPMMIAKDRKATLQAIHTMAVNQAVTSLRRNVVLDDRPPLINISEKELTRKEHTTLAQLRSRHYRLIGSYKSRISEDASLDACAYCGRTPHDVKHLFNCPAHPTTLTPSDLWNRPVDTIRELSYLETGVPD